MGRALCLLWLLAGCYSTSPAEGLDCSQSGKCPSGLQCDPDTFTCVKDLPPQFALDTIKAGKRHSCGITVNGDLFCWGDNSSGQLGLGDAMSRAFATEVTAPGGPWTSVSPGDAGTCAINYQGALYCWGSEDTVGTFSNTPRMLSGSWKSVSVGEGGFCAIDSNDKPWCSWAGGAFTEVPNAPPANRIAASAGHACAVSDAGDLYCWGTNDHLQVGVNTNGLDAPITPIAGSWDTVAVAADHACANHKNGELYCWGDCEFREGGHDPVGAPYCPPTLVDNNNTYVTVSVGGLQTCAVTATNRVVCFGRNDRGQLGRTTLEPFALPDVIDTATFFDSVSVGEDHTCATNSGHTGAYCWGDNAYGQLGNGDVARSVAPAQVSGVGWLSVSAGIATTCAIGTDHSLWCWGYNGSSQLGDGTTERKLVPSRVGGGSDWFEVSVGTTHVCALRGMPPNSTLWCWGNNEHGQLGLGSTADVTEKQPIQIGTTADWKEVQAGTYLSCGIRSGGTGTEGLYCWGDDDELAPHPIDVPTPTYAMLSANANLAMESQYMFVVVLMSQLNTATTKAVTSDMHVPSPGTLVAAAADDHQCAVDNNFVLRCWSTADTGLGTVIGSGTWKTVDVGHAGSCAIRGDDTLWCFGAAITLGSATVNEVTPAPTQVMKGTTWKSISVGEHYACAIQMDDSLWCWGANAAGELGGGPAGAQRPIHVVKGMM